MFGSGLGLNRIKSINIYYARLINTLNLAESGAANSYSYTPTSNGDFTGGVAGTSNRRIIGDGWFQLRLDAWLLANRGPLVGLKTTQATGSYTTTLFSVYQTANTNSYRVSTGGTGGQIPATPTLVETNDIIRIGRTGTTGYVAISKNNGVTFTIINTWLGITTDDLWPIMVFGATSTTISNLRIKTKPNNKATQIIVDGNSIYTNYLSTSTFATLLHNTYTKYNCYDVAIAGQTWANMNTTTTDITALYNAEKNNILVCAETTNSVNVDGLTANQVYTAASLYISTILAACPMMRIILCGSIPRYKTVDINQTMINADALMQANYLTMGAIKYVNYRDTFPFNHDGSQESYFSDNQTYWKDLSDWTHPSDLGKQIMVNKIIEKINTII